MVVSVRNGIDGVLLDGVHWSNKLPINSCFLIKLAEIKKQEKTWAKFHVYLVQISTSIFKYLFAAVSQGFFPRVKFEKTFQFNEFCDPLSV